MKTNCPREPAYPLCVEDNLPPGAEVDPAALFDALLLIFGNELESVLLDH